MAVLGCPGPLSRRNFLKIGALTLGGLGTHGVVPWQLRANDTPRTENKSVIFIWLPGGPPHTETYDMKPDAPSEYRGDFRPIQTNVPGIDLCEHLPLHSRVADKFAIIRSIAHEFADHGGGHKRFLTGRDPRSPVGFVNDYPMVGSMVARVRPERPGGLPSYIMGADGGRDQIDTFSFGSAYLGAATHPFNVSGDPADPRFEVRNLTFTQPAQRMNDRLDLLTRLDTANPAGDHTGAMASIDTYRQRSLNLLTTDAARIAFDIHREPRQVRERYGLHRYGQRALLARRLVEAGATFVTMVMENPITLDGTIPADATYNWDSHAVNCHIFNDLRFRFPMYDRAIAALIADLVDRGLDQQVMLIVTGEFGRTPRLEYSNGRPGRDHWPLAMSVLVSGGGMRMGQLIGSTTRRGEEPHTRRMTPNDLWATMFHHLGIDYANTSFLDHTGRPMPMLPFGTPIAELIG